MSECTCVPCICISISPTNAKWRPRWYFKCFWGIFGLITIHTKRYTSIRVWHCMITSPIKNCVRSFSPFIPNPSGHFRNIVPTFSYTVSLRVLHIIHIPHEQTTTKLYTIVYIHPSLSLSLENLQRNIFLSLSLSIHIWIIIIILYNVAQKEKGTSLTSLP